MTTPELILKAQGFLCMEAELRADLRRALSAILMNTDEEHPMDMYIALEFPDTYGMSSLEMPHIVKAWQHPTEGWIYFLEEGGDYPLDFDSYDTKNLIHIFEELSAEHPIEVKKPESRTIHTVFGEFIIEGNTATSVTDKDFQYHLPMPNMTNDEIKSYFELLKEQEE